MSKDLKKIRSSSFDTTEIPETINCFRDFWESKFNEVPYEYHELITIEFETYDNYSAIGTEVHIYYEREKTPDEKEEEKKKSDTLQKKKRQRQKEEYERLKKIFEGE